MSKIDAAQIWSLSYRLVSGVLAEAAPDIAALGLDVKELLVLAAVDEHPYPAELASTLCMPKPTVTAQLKRLEGAGLLEREIDRDDLRRHRLRMTTAGKRVASKGFAFISDAFSARLSHISAAEREALGRTLTKLLGPSGD
jgi:DNA-binding MarR family transcriptional regulator